MVAVDIALQAFAGLLLLINAFMVSVNGGSLISHLSMMIVTRLLPFIMGALMIVNAYLRQVGFF